MRAIKAVVSIVALSCLVGCASTHAPRQWLPPVQAAGQDTFGGWIELWQGKGPEARKSEGELIAVAPDRLVVMTPHGVKEVSTQTISRAFVTGFDPDMKRINSWITGGAISSLSHGVWLVITLPAWIWTGRIATGEALRHAEVSFPDAMWVDFARYARFPQGLPENFDLTALKAKPQIRPPAPADKSSVPLPR
jgi:hypothetical protein